MYRTIIFLGLAIATYCLFGIVTPPSLSPLTFLLPSGLFALANIFLALVLIHFGIASYFRRYRYKIGFGMLGTFLLLLIFLGIVYPTYFGLLQHDVRPANLLTLLLSGIGYLMAAAEYNRPTLMQEVLLYHLSSGLQKSPRKMVRKSAS